MMIVSIITYDSSYELYFTSCTIIRNLVNLYSLSNLFYSYVNRLYISFNSWPDSQKPTALSHTYCISRNTNLLLQCLDNTYVSVAILLSNKVDSVVMTMQ